MKCSFLSAANSQPDPYIFEDNGKFYLYATAGPGVSAYSSDSPVGPWTHEGYVCTIEGRVSYWAPCILKYEGQYYLYFSCQNKGGSPGVDQHLFVARGDSPLGPFRDITELYDIFSIDAHVVQTEAGLFLLYVKDSLTDERIGSRIFVDRLLDPMTPAHESVQLIGPSLPQELFRANRFGDGRDWYTLEGPFWFREGNWQYILYSGACFENDTYHIGYVRAPADEPDLTKVRFEKHTRHGEFDPLMIKNSYEEGVGHNSLIFWNGEYYAIYHARDYRDAPASSGDHRTARICRLTVKDGIITAHPHPDKLL